jgi:hypothetical protein
MGAAAPRDDIQDRAARNRRTALILATISLAFAVGFVVRMWLT